MLPGSLSPAVSVQIRVLAPFTLPLLTASFLSKGERARRNEPPSRRVSFALVLAASGFGRFLA